MAFWRLYYHLIWSTKDRQPLIQPAIEKRLYAYIVSKAAELESYVYAIDGWQDHIHLVLAIPPKYAVAQVVKHLKGASSHDVNHTAGLAYAFAWQRGYGALSLGERHRPQAEAYVLAQKTHHSQQTSIPWLERDAEFDEGPIEKGLARGPIPSVAVREPGVAYLMDEEPPF
jgi:putative transposase